MFNEVAFDRFPDMERSPTAALSATQPAPQNPPLTSPAINHGLALRRADRCIIIYLHGENRQEQTIHIVTYKRRITCH